MHDFKRTNKITGVHWLKDSIKGFKIKVKLRPKDGILTLPKFEEYANNTNSINIDTFEKTDEYSFMWQEKVFSLWELQRYTDVHNCITETELEYHNNINESDIESSKIFTYVHEDYHLPLPLESIRKDSSKFDLSSCLEKLNLGKKIERVIGEDTSSMGQLFKSEEDLALVGNQWKAMHIVYDSSEYNEDSQLLYKQEAILLSLYHNVVYNYLLVSPDKNDLDLNPYCVETESGVPLGFEYAVDVFFEDSEESAEELKMLLKKLTKKWEKKHKQLLGFSMPLLGKKTYQLTLEILSATHFDMDDLYIEFHFKIPDGVQCSDSSHGRTHTAAALLVNDEAVWCYGHVIEMSFEGIDNLEPPQIQIFFEVVSTDWWGRHRTEGYSYTPLDLQPGYKKKSLSCSRPEESDRVQAESRRFFVGGCHLIKDLDVLTKPQLQDADFVYVTTGSINLRWHVITQSPIPGLTKKVEVAPGSSSASALIMGAEAVLKQYRKARARLAAATKDLEVNRDGSSDGES